MSKISISASQLVIGDPHAQPGLITTIPDHVTPVQIVNFYHYYLWPQEKAYCAKCGAHRHRDGYTVELSDGSFALAGSKCGADLWGDHWTAVRKTFRTKLHAAGIVLDVSQILSELEDIRAKLDTSWRPMVTQLHSFQNKFKGQMRPLYRVLKEAAERSNHAFIAPGKHARTVEGWSFFTTDGVNQQFENALAQIDLAISIGHGKESELGARTVDLGQARDCLDEIAHAARGLRNFFNQESIYFSALILDANLLMTGPTDHQSSTRGASIVDLTTGTSIALPADYPILNIVPLRKLNDLISKSVNP